MADTRRSNAASGTGTLTILTITSDQQADQNATEQLTTSAVIRSLIQDFKFRINNGLPNSVIVVILFHLLVLIFTTPTQFSVDDAVINPILR